MEAAEFRKQEGWSIRPCFCYKEEYDECSGIKGRFHQYFIHGESTDCSQWYKDYENCIKYEKSDGNDLESGKAIIESEKNRRLVRLKAHYGNDVWKKRTAPPPDWNKKLPEWLEKRNENTYLEIKAGEMNGKIPIKEEDRSYCSIM